MRLRHRRLGRHALHSDRLDSDSFNDRKSEIFWSRDLRLDAMREYAGEVDQLYAAVAVATKRTKRLVRRAAFLAIGLETMRFQPSKASEFWHGVAADNGLMNGDPRKALLDWAQINVVAGYTGVLNRSAPPRSPGMGSSRIAT